MNRKKTLLISLLIILIGVIVTYFIFINEPKAKRQGATKETAMLVEVEPAERGNFMPEIRATGTVIPSKEIILSPRVNGEILHMSESFVPGGFVRKGELLFRIDSSDYKNALQLRKSELSQAMADLKVEMGRQNVAQKDYQLFNETLPEEDRALILREPQLNAIKARVDAAKAAVNQAELELERTAVRAPFDAQIVNRNVNLGSQVSPGENLGRLIAIDEYWVIVNVPLSHVKWLSFPEKDKKKGSPVSLKNRTAWKQGEKRKGTLFRLIGELEEDTRLARIIITVPDPLSIESDMVNRQKLMIGEFLEVMVTGNELNDIIRINRDYLRENETVWVMKNEKLDIRKIDILLKDAEYAYISSGLVEGEKVITSNLSSVTQGAKLRLEGDSKGNAKKLETNINE